MGLAIEANAAAVAALGTVTINGDGGVIRVEGACIIYSKGGVVYIDAAAAACGFVIGNGGTSADLC